MEAAWHRCHPTFAGGAAQLFGRKVLVGGAAPCWFRDGGDKPGWGAAMGIYRDQLDAKMSRRRDTNSAVA